MNVFLFMVLSLFGGSGSNEVRDNCDRLKITYDTQVVGDKITISVQASGGTEPYYYFFLDKNLNMISLDVKKNICTADKGTLPKLLRVIDSGGCTQTLEFNETSLR
jgi:hypothetical protein